MNKIIEALKGIVQCCDGNEPKHEQIYHIANDAIKEAEAEQLILSDVSGSAFLTMLLSEIKQHEREIISDPHRFTGISTAELERVFDKHGVKMKIPF